MAKCFTKSLNITTDPLIKPFSYQLLSPNSPKQTTHDSIGVLHFSLEQNLNTSSMRSENVTFHRATSVPNPSPSSLNPYPSSPDDVDNICPLVCDVSTPNLSLVSNLSDNPKETSVYVPCTLGYESYSPTSIPYVCDLSTPDISDINFDIDEGLLSEHMLNPNAKPFTPTPDSVYIADSMIESPCLTGSANNIQNSPHSILKELRMKNVDKIIVGHININSTRNKIDQFADLIKDRIDIILVSETKLDNTFPRPQFKIPGYTLPLRLDRNKNGGGVLLYIRGDIPSKPLNLIYEGIECLISEIIISKKKWLLLGTYNPHKTMISNHLCTLGQNLGHYLPSYDNIMVLGDLNSEPHEDDMSEFCSLFNLKNLIKVPTCFKNPDNPSCIDLILTNHPHCFQNSTTIETGLSDFHKLTVTVMKTSFRKMPPKVVMYRNYKHYSKNKFCDDMNSYLSNIDLNQISNDDYVFLVMEILNRHAPLKQRLVRANDSPFITKNLRKEHMKRSRLRNKYLREKSEETAKAYRKQRNKCVPC